MTIEERNIVYEAAPPVEPAVTEQDVKDYPNSTFAIISKVAYLIGVPKRFFENEHSSPQMDVYQSIYPHGKAFRMHCRLNIIR